MGQYARLDKWIFLDLRNKSIEDFLSQTLKGKYASSEVIEGNVKLNLTISSKQRIHLTIY